MARCRKIKDFPGYKVSVLGVVWSDKLGVWRRLRPIITHWGYACVKLCRDGKIYRKWIHRLVLEAFVGPCPPGMETRHFPDQDRSNNRLDNLSWGTRSRNYKDRKHHGTENDGERNGRAKLTEKKVKRIRRLHKTNDYTQQSLADFFGVSVSVLNGIILRKIWRHVNG